MQVERFEDLNVRVCGGTDGAGGGDGPAIVLMHGFGAPGDDLVGLSRVLPVPSGTRFLFPEAPLALDTWGSRAWWPIDPESLERRARGERVDRSYEEPPELPSVRGQLLRCLDALQARLGITEDQLVLGGFSQGSMLALDVTLHREAKPRALVLWSSTLIAWPQWEPRMPSCAGLPVLQSHGTHDPLLPFEAAETLRDRLQQAGARVQFVPFVGGHEIPPEVLAPLSDLLFAELDS